MSNGLETIGAVGVIALIIAAFIGLVILMNTTVITISGATAALVLLAVVIITAFVSFNAGKDF